MASHVSHCMAKAYACRTHGKPCVCHMACHVSSCMAMLRPINMRLWGAENGVRGIAASSVCGSSKEKEEEGRKGEEKGRKGKEKGRRREEKGKKKREEERGGREEKERGKGRSVVQ